MSNLSVRRSLLALAVPLALVASLAACTSDGSGGAAGSGTEVFAAAQEQLAKAASVDLSLVTTDLPKGVNGLISAEGLATDAPAFEGTITLAYSGMTPEVPVVAVDGKVWAKLPFTTDFTEIDPAEFKAPDPADLVNTESGFGHLLGEVKDLEKGDTVRGGTDNKDVLTTWTGTIAGAAVKEVMPSADVDQEFTGEFQFDDTGAVRQLSLTGVFYPGSDDMTYTVTISEYSDTARTITAP